jgi:uncharacterized lipoprotein
MKAFIFWLAAGLALLGGCALTPQQLHLDPTVSVQSPPVGNGTIVGLAVEDSRSDTKLGEVGDPNTKMVEVGLSEDFKPRLHDEVAKALTSLGFTVVDYSEQPDRTLTIEVKRLDLRSVKQAFVFDTELRAELGAIAKNGADTFDRVYYVRTKRETGGPPFLKDSNVLINTAVSQALSDILADEKLLELLSR